MERQRQNNKQRADPCTDTAPSTSKIRKKRKTNAEYQREYRLRRASVWSEQELKKQAAEYHRNYRARKKLKKARELEHQLQQSKLHNLPAKTPSSDTVRQGRSDEQITRADPCVDVACSTSGIIIKEMLKNTNINMSIDNKPWVPKDHTRVCSAHFVGGIKSEDMHSEAYVPSIFPNGIKKELFDTIEPPAKRSRDMETLALSPQAPLFEDMFEIVNIKCEIPEIETSTIACQTDPWFDQPTDETNILFCWNGVNESSTQTEIYVRQPFKRKKVIIEPSNTMDKLCGSDEEMNPSLWRFLEITTDSTMRQLTGIPYDFFVLLLSLIMPNKAGQPAYFKKLGKEDRLFLFLVKMKLGISFGALGCLFHVHSTTASRIFFQILETLTEKTKNWIFWPTRENAKKCLPSTFNKYPGCRCLLANMEVRTETPSSIDQKLAIHSDNASISTTKFVLAITPDGYVCKISKGYGYNATNSFIVNDSGFLDVLQSGDTILADENFKQIESDLAERGATLVIPQSVELVNDNATKKACVRVHVNRAVQKLKLLRILENFSIELLNHKESIMHMCCVIANGNALIEREKLTPQIVSPHYIGE